MKRKNDPHGFRKMNRTALYARELALKGSLSPAMREDARAAVLSEIKAINDELDARGRMQSALIDRLAAERPAARRYAGV